ncbi:uncharacterized protein [Physcomitrium patens]|uniref:uncharacterized protein isoform X2 n=1 Tax=Physcomitrium patens TaxID=3218 RepID=UPI003CCD44B1
MPRFFFFYFFFYCWQTWGGETVVHEIILAWSVFLSGFLSRNCNYFCSFFFVPGLSCRLFFFVRFIGLQVSVMQLFKPPKAPCQMQKNHPKLFLDTGWISCALHFQIIHCVL